MPATATATQCKGTSVYTGNHCKRRTARDGKCWQHQELEDGLRIKKSNHRTKNGDSPGLGLYAAKPFDKKKKVCTYKGKNINKATVESRSDEQNNYVLKVSNNNFIDASKPTSCYGRFINSYAGLRGNPRSNVKLVAAARAKQKTIKIETTKKVPKGKEFLVNYGGKGGDYTDTDPKKKNKKTLR